MSEVNLTQEEYETFNDYLYTVDSYEDLAVGFLNVDGWKDRYLGFYEVCENKFPNMGAVMTFIKSNSFIEYTAQCSGVFRADATTEMKIDDPKDVENVDWTGVWYDELKTIENFEFEPDEDYIEVHSSIVLNPYDTIFGGK